MLSDKGLAVATISKHSKRAKTMLAEAVRDRLLSESPFDELKGGNESNPIRQRFIDATVTDKVLAACPDADWRAIFVLARFCGLRCPSEVLNLKWTDVDWAENRLRIDSSKTGLRFCPLFPEVRAVLGDAFFVPDGAVYVVGRYRGAESNLRTQFNRILESAGVIPWPKLFHNLRATRRTELQEIFPDHVINEWLGHSGAVAAKHYLQVTPEHWAKAADSRSPTGTPIPDNHGPLVAITETTKPSVLLGSDGCGGLVIPPIVTPMGVEPMLPP
jgi:integrase